MPATVQALGYEELYGEQGQLVRAGGQKPKAADYPGQRIIRGSFNNRD